MHVIEVHDINTLEAYRQPWLDLLDEISGSSTVFASPGWVMEWWRQFGEGAELHVLLLMQETTLIGIAPLAIWRWPFAAGPVRVLRFVGHGTSDHLDFCVHPDYRLAGLSLLCDHIRDELRWHLADLLDIPEDSPNLELMRVTLGRGAQTALLLRGIVCPYLRLESRPWDAFYTAQRSKSSRKDLERRQRRLAELGELVFRRYDDPLGVPKVFPKLFALYAKRWDEQFLSVSFAGTQEQRFYPAMAAALAEQGRLDLVTLELDQRVLAFSLGAVHKDCFTWLITAHDPEYAKYFPGELMITHLLESVFSRGGITEFDFTRGEEPYKYKWANAERYNMRLLIARPSPPGLLPLLGTGAYSVLRRQAKKSRLLREAKLRWMGKLQGLLTKFRPRQEP
jgi:CelD/BcsL family acetyltransferase involved in cellulose biosynthesis